MKATITFCIRPLDNLILVFNTGVSFIILEAFDLYKAEAEKLGIGYLTLMQLKLREALGNPLEKRIQALEKKLKRA